MVVTIGKEEKEEFGKKVVYNLENRVLKSWKCNGWLQCFGLSITKTPK